MPRSKTEVAYFDAHQLRCLISGSRELLDAVLEEMTSNTRFSDQVEIVCAMLAVTEGKAKELIELCGEHDDEQGTAPTGA